MIDLEELAGTTINEAFVLDRCVGKGASGVVYRAKTTKNEWIALKLVAPNLGTGNSSARYLRGTRLASQLNHPHIVQVRESGRWGPKRRYSHAPTADGSTADGTRRSTGDPQKMGESAGSGEALA